MNDFMPEFTNNLFLCFGVLSSVKILFDRDRSTYFDVDLSIVLFQNINGFN